MIDKITPRGLDKSSDHKLVSKASMIDAVNLYIADDYVNEEGNAGVLKSVRGNIEVQYATDSDRPLFPLANTKVIGSVTDNKTKIIYLFIWSQHLQDHGVWAFDPYGKLPLSETEPQGVPNSLRKVFTSTGQWSGFNFQEHGFVKGDIVYTNTNELMKYDAIKDYLNASGNESLKIDFEKDVLIYFTDNVNEPRRLNPYRALLQNTLLTYGASDKEDLVCACPKTPLDRITFEWDTDEDILTNNFATTPGFQYAYQAIYKDKIESAISAYSTIAFSPSVVHRGAAPTNLLLAHNKCILTIPQLGPEVETIRILARYGNTSNFFEIDEVPNLEMEDTDNWNSEARTYDFRNDRIGFGVSFNEVDKTFDRLPRKAQAQTTISNRLVYGNYLEGFDNVKTDCTSEVIYKERPDDYLDYILKVRPSIHRTPYGNNKCVGFDLDTTEFSSKIYEGTEVSVTINYSPDQNFHIYQADGAYHQSRQVGSSSVNAFGYKRWPLSAENNHFTNLNDNFGGDGQSLADGITFSGSPAEQQEIADYSVLKKYDWPQVGFGDDPSIKFLTHYGERFFGRNYGVGSDGDYSTDIDWPFYSGANAFGSDSNLPFWKCGIGGSVAIEQYYNSYWDPIGYNQGESMCARYGTSAGNPLILQGAKLQFKVKFRMLNDELWNGKKLIAETVAEALAGFTNDQLSWNADFPSYPRVELLDVQKEQTVSIDLGINGGGPGDYNFDSVAQDHPYAYLITGVGESLSSHNQITNPGNFYSTRKNHHKSQHIPMGYFIVNKAEVDFYLELVDGDELSYPSTALSPNQLGSGDSIKSRMRLGISRIEPDEDDGLLTCIRKIDPRSPWWFVSKSVLETSTFQNDLASGSQNVKDAFSIPNPMFAESESFFNEFMARFYGGVLETTSGHPKAVNRRCFGYIQAYSGNTFFRSHTPEPGVSKFRFSLMDGEGGPGGSMAGGDSAYDRYGNANWGSIAGRVDIDYNSGDSQLARKSVEVTDFDFGDNYGKHFQAFDGGSQGFDDFEDFDPEGPPQDVEAWGGPMFVGDSAVANERDLNQYSSDKWYVLYHVSGPFFTGSIAMNPIDQDGAGASYEGESNPNSFPHVKDYSTTLPLIWINSRGVPLHEVYEAWADDSDVDGDEFNQNWLRTQYPWPQTISDPGGLPLYNDDGIASFEVDPRPFSINYAAALNDDGTLPNNIDNNLMTGIDENDSPLYQDHFGSVDFTKLHSHIECVGASSYVPSDELDFRSFKTSATHEFGVVYYDERGRHGAVNHLDSVYVDGYSTQERGAALHGAVAIQLTLNHEAPDWATNWKIVYSKNTSVNNFVQYSAGGAFVPQGSSSANDPSRIYVSLNHLQGRPISYTQAWGASDENIELTDSTMPLMYKFTKGDRLRVISYMLPPLSGQEDNCPPRQYPLSFEFEVADMVSLTAENNPLIVPYSSDDGEDQFSNEKQGLFLVLKNNLACQGFRYEDVKSGSHLWGDNCVVEIYTPTKELDADDRLYYEIGEKYNVHNGAHLPNTVTLTEGDVYFRRAAVNMREYDEDGLDGMDGYQPLIINVVEENPDTPEIEFRIPESNFKSYYIESPVASDLFKSDAISIGRPNAIDHDAREAFKEASVIHSDRDITDAGKVSYSSFNNSLAIDKDLDLKSGGVNYLVNHDDSIFVIQKDKCGHIPIDRTLISDVMGEESLIASSKFLGTPRYYVGKAGADDNPESVVNINNTAYFAHKSLGKVFRASGVNGINVISDIGMNSYFREVFNNAMAASMASGNDVRVVGGYDPIHEEYLLTIVNPETYGLAQPIPPPDPDFPPPAWDICKWFTGTESLVSAQDPGSIFTWYNNPAYITVADVATEIYGGEPGPFTLADTLIESSNADVVTYIGDGSGNWSYADLQQFINLYLTDGNFLITLSSLAETCDFDIGIPDPDSDVDPDVGLEDDPFVEGDPDVDPDVGLEDDPFTEDDYYQDPDVNLEDEGLDPLVWTGNFCDYPMLVATALDVVNLDTITSAFNQVVSQVSLGVITQEQATYLFPDLSGDGQIGSADLTNILQMSSEFPISCAVEPPPPPPPPLEPLPYTGSLCDYNIGSPQNPTVITNDSILFHFNQVIQQILNGEITQVEATQIFPDLNNDGAITSAELQILLSSDIQSQLPIDCTGGGTQKRSKIKK